MQLKKIIFSPSFLWKFLLVYTWLTLISISFNIGISRFFIGFPVFVFALIICFFRVRNNHWTLITALIMVVSYINYKTLEDNKFVFPILENGTLTVIEDGFYQEFSDGSGGFVKENDDQGVTYTTLHKGQILPVTDIKISSSELMADIHIHTEVGYFSSYEYEDPPMLSWDIALYPNKTVHSKWAQKMSNLKSLPWLIILSPLLLLSFFT